MVCAFSFSCSKGVSSWHKMYLSQYCKVSQCRWPFRSVRGTSALHDERNLQTASTVLFYTLLKDMHFWNADISIFLYQLHKLWAPCRACAFWEHFQAGVYLKSFSVQNKYVTTAQCSSHSWGRFGSTQLVLSWFTTTEESQIVDGLVFTPYRNRPSLTQNHMNGTGV